MHYKTNLPSFQKGVRTRLGINNIENILVSEDFYEKLKTQIKEKISIEETTEFNALMGIPVVKCEYLFSNYCIIYENGKIEIGGKGEK